MTEVTLVLFAAGGALFMAMLARAGVHPNLRAAVRTTVVLVLGWSFAGAIKRPHSLRDLSWRVWLMLAISILAVALAWYFYFRGRQAPETTPVAVTDRINVLFAVLFAALLLCGGSTSGPGLGVLLLIGGALILAWNRN